MQPPRFAVIIPTLGSPARLGLCLKALAAQEYPSRLFEVIVVNDGGRELIDQIVNAMSDMRRAGIRVRVLRQSRSGPGPARNTGAAATDAEYLAFTDDDCVPDPGWLDAFARRVQADGSSRRLYGGRVCTGLPWNSCTEASQLILDLSYAYHNPDPANARFFASCNIAMPAAGFRALGGFDPSFRVASEDRDLCERWGEADGRLAFVEEAAVTHLDSLTVPGFLRRHFWYGRGAWQFHGALRARNRGRFVRDVQFHAGFLMKAARRLAPVSTTHKLQLAGLLILWQCANAAGFLYEAVRGIWTALRAGRRQPAAFAAGLRRAGREHVGESLPPA